MKEQTRKDMQQKMADYRMSAPEVSWAEIERAVSVQTRPATIIPMWRKRIAVVATIILIAVGGGFWMLHHQGKSESQQSDLNVIVLKANKTNEPSTMAETSVQPTITSTTKPTVYSDVATTTNISETEVSTLSHEDAPEENNTQTTEQSAQQPYSPPSLPLTPSEPIPTQVNTRLTAKVYIGNSMNGYAGSTAFTPMLMSAPIFGIYNDAIDYKGDTPLHEDAPEFKTSVRHHQPLRFGLSLRYDINNRWSVESGLSYAHHKSDLINQSGDSKTTVEQRLSYIGIPLNVGYRIWSYRHFNFYISAGGMVEKMVKGNRSIQDAAENISIRHLQFSLNGMAGAEFRIDKSFSLYTEPGLSYHFDNGSNVPTIYQDEPLNFNLNIGLRFSFK